MMDPAIHARATIAQTGSRALVAASPSCAPPHAKQQSAVAGELPNSFFTSGWACRIPRARSRCQTASGFSSSGTRSRISTSKPGNTGAALPRTRIWNRGRKRDGDRAALADGEDGAAVDILDTGIDGRRLKLPIAVLPGRA